MVFLRQGWKSGPFASRSVRLWLRATQGRVKPPALLQVRQFPLARMFSGEGYSCELLAARLTAAGEWVPWKRDMAGKQDHLLIPQPVMVSPFHVLLGKKLTEQDYILEMRKKKDLKEEVPKLSIG